MDQADYYAAAKELSSRPAGPDHPKQEFKRGSRVHICKNMPREMDHFESDLDAIVDHTYAQQFGGNNVDSYALLLIDSEDGRLSFAAWYKEDQLTLVSDDIEAGLKLIDQYERMDEEGDE